MGWSRRFWMLGMVVVAVVSPARAAASKPLRSGLTERVEVERVRWPIRMKESRPGACAGLQAGNLQVSEDGEPRRVTAVELGRQDTAHLLLVDVSGSMLRWLPRVRQAAENYMQGLPTEDSVGLATFGEDLYLRRTLAAGVSPLDGRRLIPEPDELRYTSLWDAVDGAVRYLDGLAERKVLILLTDGCDSLSRPENSLQTVEERAARVAGLTILPLVAGFGATCGPGPYEARQMRPASRSGPERLARRTGGTVYDLRSEAQVSAAFARIRRGLDREGVVVYARTDDEPDRGRGGDDRWTRVRVRSRRQGCKVESAGAGQRLIAEAQVVPAHPMQVLVRAGDSVAMKVLDLIRDRGDLYVAPGRFILSQDREPLWAVRSVRMLLPDLSDIQDSSLSALERVARGMDRALKESDETTPVESFFMHGAAMLEERVGLAAVLLKQPGYGEWARRRVHEERLKTLGVTLAGEVNQLLQAQSDGERLSLVDAPVTADDAAPYLAAWLADVRARDVAQALDERWCKTLLGRHEDGSMTPGHDEMLAAWSRLRRVLGPPTEVRIRTLLVPAFEPVRRVVGFARIHLPESRMGRPPLDMLPLRPPALALTTRVAALGGAEGHADLVDIEDVTYGRPHRHEKQVFGSWIGMSMAASEHLWIVDMETVWQRAGAQAAPEHARILTRSFLDLGSGRLCVTLPAGEKGGGQGTLGWLDGRLRVEHLACPEELFREN